MNRKDLLEVAAIAFVVLAALAWPYVFTVWMLSHACAR
jgi:hypothetical protein